jgi:hypothetical protein
MREGDRVARPHPQAAPAAEVVDRPGDDPEPNEVELAEKRRHISRERAVDERLEQHGLGAVLALVHRDELGEDGIRAFSAGAPSLDPADQPFRPSPQRGFDETFLRRCVKVDRARSDVGAPRDLAHSQVRIATARDLAQGGRLDRA